MLNDDYKEMLQYLVDEGVKFLLVGAYAMAALTSDLSRWRLRVCASESRV